MKRNTHALRIICALVRGRALFTWQETRVCGFGPGVSAMAQSALRDSSPPRGLLPLWIRLHARRKTVTVLVTANDTVLDVKGKINETENIPQEQQCLICKPPTGSVNESVMDDARTIGSYLPQLESRCSNDNTVELVTPCAIFVTNSISGAQLQLNVRLDYDSLPDVKKTIEEKTKIPVALQHLMFAGDVVDDADWLSLDLRGIEDGSTLDLVVSSAEVPSSLPIQRAIIDEYARQASELARQLLTNILNLNLRDETPPRRDYPCTGEYIV